jgi:phosphatidylcholine synthase
MVFVPIHYIYPTRTQTFKALTLALATIWGVLFMWMLWRLPAVGGPWTMASFIFPAYYLALSLWLQFRR